MLVAQRAPQMSRSKARRSCRLTNPSIAVSIVLFLACSLQAGGLFAAQREYSTEGGNGSTVEYVPATQEGVRNVFIEMTPGKEKVLEEIKRNSRNLPDPKFAKLIEGKHPAVVRVNVEAEGSAVHHGSGTLVAVSERYGIVVTNWHVVRDRVGRITVRFPDGFFAQADVLKTDKTWDLAALLIARPRVAPVKLSKRVPKVGEVLTIAGYGGGTYRQSTGRMLQFCAPGMGEPADILELTTAARSGDSGGPIFAQDGTLSGVVFGSVSDTCNGSHVGRVRDFLLPVLAQSPYVDDRARARTVSY